MKKQTALVTAFVCFSCTGDPEAGSTHSDGSAPARDAQPENDSMPTRDDARIQTDGPGADVQPESDSILDDGGGPLPETLCREGLLKVKGSVGGESVDIAISVDPGTQPVVVDGDGHTRVRLGTVDGGLVNLDIDPSGTATGSLRNSDLLVSACGPDSSAAFVYERFVAFSFRSLVSGLDCPAESIQGELVGCVDVEASAPQTGNDAGM